MAVSTHGHKFTPNGSISSLLVSADTPKALDYCMKHLTYAGRNHPYFRFSDLGISDLKDFINKAKTIKTHEILKCSGCRSCEEK